ncbi:hypothetical protein RFI_14665 [Reticulomyxa filosa]|uniref:Uncharacterized protein n=1 Tax=Reticulomyxa filosa TaxID=46433 RepID=X6N9W1_RETFI|nr:hypothetical protein RFI_14665 [Reticulomyxa filosa]|eukprot:ETO22534.1 hypothetical protein RFI_14665 [Reticulomyxa filosa]
MINYGTSIESHISRLVYLFVRRRRNTGECGIAFECIEQGAENFDNPWQIQRVFSCIRNLDPLAANHIKTSGVQSQQPGVCVRRITCSVGIDSVSVAKPYKVATTAYSKRCQVRGQHKTHGNKYGKTDDMDRKDHDQDDEPKNSWERASDVVVRNRIDHRQSMSVLKRASGDIRGHLQSMDVVWNSMLQDMGEYFVTICTQIRERNNEPKTSVYFTLIRAPMQLLSIVTMRRPWRVNHQYTFVGRLSSAFNFAQRRWNYDSLLETKVNWYFKKKKRCIKKNNNKKKKNI